MATYERREVTTYAVEFVVPAPWPKGACWVELTKAISAAHQELVASRKLKNCEEAADDLIRLIPGDGEIIVRFEEDAIRA
ncbi:hypothetical protein [Amycolatopsis sp. NPDC059657]|uniref:hypothetical protein n=1 Tax=Amycolatopsis sp. NPDC059657 TaxID=3346899 RepID=UPI00366D0E3B